MYLYIYIIYIYIYIYNIQLYIFVRPTGVYIFLDSLGAGGREYMYICTWLFFSFREIGIKIKIPATRGLLKFPV